MEPIRKRLPTWLGLLLMALAVVLAGAAGLLLEWMTSARFSRP